MKTETEIKAGERCIRIPGELHRKLRIISALCAETMTAIASEALRTEIRRRERTASASPAPNETDPTCNTNQ